jgi:peroxiredoxin Q/BCP
MLQEGIQAPSFTALDQFEVSHTLSGYKGSFVILYFYPKDNTPGCTAEACAIRDSWQDFRDKNIIVLGVSADSSKSHKNFSEKYSLPFPLLVDSDKKILRAYEAIGMKKMFGRTYEGILRISYLIGPDGKIAKAYPKVKPNEHAAEILRDVDSITK